MAAKFALAMAGAAAAHQPAAASRQGNGQQIAGRTRRTSADPQRAQQGATAAAAAAPAALDSLSRLQQLANASPQVAQLRRLQALADGRFAPVAQLAGDPEEEVLVQGKFATAQLQPQLQHAPRANNTGLPDKLKSGIESLSGLSMDHVRVHYNSSQPAQLNALAYAQGSEIHIAPGQERHLPHEAWHVVQQAQGRVKPTMQMAGGVAVNNDAGLEREADVMGAKALERGPRADGINCPNSIPIATTPQIEGGTTNSPDVTVANNDSADLANGRGSAWQGGAELQRMADQRPQAALQGEEDGRAVETKKLDLTPGSAGSVRVVAQARYLDGLFGAAQLRPDPANASFSQVKKNDRAFGTTLQCRRVPGESEIPVPSMRVWINPVMGNQTYIQYANAQYNENKKRAAIIIAKIVDSLRQSSPNGAQNPTYSPPDEKEWQVVPKSGSTISFKNYGLKIEYNHRKLMHAKDMPVRYHTTFKRNKESGKVDMTANDNRAPASEDRKNSTDSVLNMNLNQIWAHQLQYFLQLESIALKEQQKISPSSVKLSSIKRSQIENPSTLATYWITSKPENVHKKYKVDDKEDWLALSGSPNGNALLWLILQSPSLGEPLDVKAIQEDPTCMYNIEVDEGPALIFN